MTEKVTREVFIDLRWYAQLEGDEQSILELQRLLRDGADDERGFFVIDWEPGVRVLATTRWNELADGREVKDAASSAIDILSGTLNVLYGCSPISIGAIYQILDDGTVQTTRTTIIEIRVQRHDAEKVSPDTYVSVLNQARDVAWLFSAVKELTPPIDWYAVYRAIEYIEVGCGGQERHMIKNPVIKGTKLKLIKQMANSVRHAADGVHKPPTPPILLFEAVHEVRTALRSLIHSDHVPLNPK